MMLCSAIDWRNFLRVDDNGNEIVVTVKDSAEEVEKITDSVQRPTRKELLNMLSEQIKSIEDLPNNAKSLPVNQYDLAAALMLIQEIFLLPQ